MKKYLYITLLCLFIVVSLVPFSFLPIKFFGLGFHYILFGIAVPIMFTLTMFENDEISSFDIWILLVIVSFSLSLITSVNVGNSLGILMKFIGGGIIIAVISKKILPAFDKYITAKAILYIAGFIAALGIIEFIIHWNPYFAFVPALINYSETYRSGMSSTIGHPLALASYMVLVFPLSIWIAQQSGKIFIFISFLIFLSIVLSFSRSSWIGVFVSMSIFFTSRNTFKILVRHKLKILLVMLLITVSLLLLPTVRHVIYRRVNLQAFISEVFKSHRAYAYEMTYRILKDYPLFGVGLGNFPKVYEKYNLFCAKNPDFYTPDNMYLRLFSEVGIIGTLTFIVFMLFWFYLFWLYRSDTLLLALLAGLAGFSINQIAADFFYWVTPLFTFWFLFGWAAGQTKIRS